MATDIYGRQATYTVIADGYATLSVVDYSGLEPFEAFTINWDGNAPGEEVAIEIANWMTPSWAISVV